MIRPIGDIAGLEAMNVGVERERSTHARDRGRNRTRAGSGDLGVDRRAHAGESLGRFALDAGELALHRARPTVIKLGRMVRYRNSDIDAYVRENTRGRVA
jgi:hypothetical protein